MLNTSLVLLARGREYIFSNEFKHYLIKACQNICPDGRCLDQRNEKVFENFPSNYAYFLQESEENALKFRIKEITEERSVKVR